MTGWVNGFLYKGSIFFVFAQYENTFTKVTDVLKRAEKTLCFKTVKVVMQINKSKDVVLFLTHCFFYLGPTSANTYLTLSM